MKKKKKADQQQNEANLQLRDTSADGGGWGGSGLIICDVSRPPPRARLARNLVPNEPYAERLWAADISRAFKYVVHATDIESAHLSGSPAPKTAARSKQRQVKLTAATKTNNGCLA